MKAQAESTVISLTHVGLLHWSNTATIASTHDSVMIMLTYFQFCFVFVLHVITDFE